MKSFLTAVLALALISMAAAPAEAATHHRHATAHAAAHKTAHHRTASHASSRHAARKTSGRHASRRSVSRHEVARHAARRHSAARHQPTTRHARHSATPIRSSGPHSWAKGQRVPAQYRTRAHYISYSRHHLKAPPKGYEWVQVDDNYALVSSKTGLISALAPADKY
jgi:Ni/Co efflux regulator RcnB